MLTRLALGLAVTSFAACSQGTATPSAADDASADASAPVSDGGIAQLDAGRFEDAAVATDAGLRFDAGARDAGTDPFDAGAPADPRAQRLDAALTSQVSQLAVVGCTAALQLGTFSWAGAAGLANRDTLLPLASSDLMRVGSITKSMVATVIMQLVDERAIALDTPVDQLLSAIPHGHELTVRQLLGHRTGLVPYQSQTAFIDGGGLGDPTRVWSPQQLVDVVKDEPLLFTPGTQFSYSNTNFIVLGMVLEAVTHQSLADAIDQRIARPLGLTRTWLDDGVRSTRLLAHGYSSTFSATGVHHAPEATTVDATFALNPSVPWAAGGIISTAPETARFFAALLGARLTSAASLTAMTTSTEPASVAAYGLGLWRYNINPPGWGHTGETAGFRSSGAARLGGEIVVAVICNDDHVEDAPQRIAQALGDAAQ